MKTSQSIRVWYVLVAAILWIGIYLTGFSAVSWLLYIPAAGFVFAAITGICPSQLAIFKMFDGKTTEMSHKKA